MAKDFNLTEKRMFSNSFHQRTARGSVYKNLLPFAKKQSIPKTLIDSFSQL